MILFIYSSSYTPMYQHPSWIYNEPIRVSIKTRPKALNQSKIEMKLKTVFLFVMHVESKYGQVLRSISYNQLGSHYNQLLWFPSIWSSVQNNFWTGSGHGSFENKRTFERQTFRSRFQTRSDSDELNLDNTWDVHSFQKSWSDALQDLQGRVLWSVHIR